MISSEYEKLHQFPVGRHISLGITEDGTPQHVFSIPWEGTAHILNMRLPDLYISAAELNDTTINAILSRFHVVGLYVLCTLDDYDLLRRFSEVEDIYILHADIDSLSFARKMPWKMFFLEGNAEFDSFEDLFPVDRNWGFHAYCLGLKNCRVKDVDAIEKSGVALSELLVWGENSKEERQKWALCRAAKFRYYRKKALAVE